jgi:hypothetical protein
LADQPEIRLLHRLGLATAARDRDTRRSSGARIAEIRLLRAPTRIVERYAHHRALAFAHLSTTSVTDQDSLSSHAFLLGRVGAICIQDGAFPS